MAPKALVTSMKITHNSNTSANVCLHSFFSDEYCIEDDDLVKAVDWASASGVDVLSMSFLGRFGASVYDALGDAYHYYDILLLGATGNPEHTQEEPVRYEFVMGVGGVNADDTNYGRDGYEEVSGFAGGRTISSTCDAVEEPTDFCRPNFNSYWSSGGTSAATANVSGIAGLLRSWHQGETAAQIRRRLQETAVGPNNKVDALAALNAPDPLAVTIQGPTIVPESTTCSWIATGAGGNPPYSYSWNRDDQYVASGATYTGSTGTATFRLQARVVDASSTLSTATITVTPDSTASPCLM